MDKDWRIVNQHAYLHGKHLRMDDFIPTEECDHVHCVFCWSKFGDDENWLHFGYRSLDNHYWICENCFQDFMQEFEWKVEGDNKTGGGGQGDGSIVPSTKTTKTAKTGDGSVS